MVIKAALTELENANHPIAKVIHNGGNCKTLAIVFKKGMVLKEHKTNIAATLIVVDGEVLYKVGKAETILKKFNQTGIPVGVLHAVEAKEDSVCLLIQG